MCTAEEYIERAHIVRHEFQEQLNRKSLKYNRHEADLTVLEGVFARGDRKTAKVLEEAYRLGCPIKRSAPYFLNLILAFITDTSSKLCCPAA